MFWLSENNTMTLNYASGVEQTIKSVNIYGNQLGQNGYIWYKFFIKKTGTGGSATIRIYFGGSLVCNAFTISASDVKPYLIGVRIIERNATDDQYIFVSIDNTPDETGSSGSSSSSSAANILAIDTSVDQEFLITAQLAGVADTLTIKSHLGDMEKA